METHFKLWSIMASILLSLALTPFLSDNVFSLGPARLRVEWSFALNGTTRVVLPPLGAVSARTHQTPIHLNVLLESIDTAQLQSIISSEDPSADLGEVLERSMMDHAINDLKKYVVFVISVGAILSGLFCFLLSGGTVHAHKRFLSAIGRRMLVAVVLAAGLLVALLPPTVYTYDPGAFRNATYHGALESIPVLIETIEQGITKSTELEQRLVALTQSLFQMYDRIDRVVPPLAIAEADVVILHVTDFHLHPGAPQLTREMANAFDVDFILNTGDLTEFGTFIEADYLRQLAHQSVPHYFVTGNHESPGIVTRIAMTDGLTLIDGAEVMQSGLKIIGVGDPAATTLSAVPPSPATSREIASRISEGIRSMEVRPDIVAIHNFRTADMIEPGLVPLIAYGHSHTPAVTFRNGTAYVNAGTTGAAGIRGVESPVPVLLSLAVIYMQHRNEGSRVIGVDIITLSPVAGGFTLERYLASEEE